MAPLPYAVLKCEPGIDPFEDWAHQSFPIPKAGLVD
jgi:hypothetical protein